MNHSAVFLECFKNKIFYTCPVINTKEIPESIFMLNIFKSFCSMNIFAIKWATFFNIVEALFQVIYCVLRIKYNEIITLSKVSKYLLHSWEKWNGAKNNMAVYDVCIISVVY